MGIGVSRALALVFVVVNASSCAPAGPAPFAVTPTGNAVEALVSAREGGTLTLAAGATTLRFAVPPGALEDDTTLGIEEVAIEGLPNAVAARFSPDGLVFNVPALWSVEPAPAGDRLVGLSFRAGAAGAELVFASPQGAGVAVPVAHFSEGAVVDADEARDHLDDDQRRDVDDVEDAAETAALGLGDRLRNQVGPAIDIADRSTTKLDAATRLLIDTLAEIQRANVGSEPASIRGTETLDQVAAAAKVRLRAKAVTHLATVTSPTCNDVGNEVTALGDWARIANSIAGTIQLLDGRAPVAAPCVTAKIVIDGDANLEPSDPNLSLDLRHELRGPRGEVELVPRTLFTLTFTGGDGPPTLEARDGTAAAVRINRAAGARTITVRVTAATADTQLAALAAATPVTFVASEASDLTLTASPASLDAPGTSQICARLTASGDAVETFEVAFTIASGPGGVEAQTFRTTTGEACARYTSPDPVPAEPTRVVVSASANIDGGAPATAQVELSLRAPATLSAAPSVPAPDLGDDVAVCGLLLAAGVPVPGVELAFAIEGAGTRTPETAVTDVDGSACTLFTTGAEGLVAIVVTTVGGAETTRLELTVGPRITGTYSGSGTASSVIRVSRDGTEVFNRALFTSFTATVVVGPNGAVAVTSASGTTTVGSGGSACENGGGQWSTEIRGARATLAGTAPGPRRLTLTAINGPVSGPATDPCNGEVVSLAGFIVLNLVLTNGTPQFVVDGGQTVTLPQQAPFTGTRRDDASMVMSRP